MAPLPLPVFILTAESRTEGDGSYVLLYGASELGPVEISERFSPYFFVEDRESEKGTLRSLSDKAVRKFSFASIREAEEARLRFQNQGLQLFESDVRARERFLMDQRINGGVLVEGEPVMRGKLLRFQNPRLTPANVTLPLKVCSLDIETSISTNCILSIAVHLTGAGADQRTVLMQGEGEACTELSLRYLPDERSLLSAFEQYLADVDPDLIIGWNVIGFDLAFLRDRAEVLNVPLRLGRGGRTFNIGESIGRFSRAHVPGRVVLDGPQLLRTSFYSFESYSLENVSQKVLGEGKLIEPTARRAWEIERLYKEDKRALAAYNLKDTTLVTRIFEKLGLIELTMRRTELCGMLLDQVSYSTASFDHFYLPRLHDEGFVAPDIGGAGEVVRAAGGYVMEPVAGMYDNIIGLDFQSLYPSIIRTFNIDPLSRACADENSIKTPNGHYFSRTRSILPAFIGQLIAERRRAKETRNAALSQAVKILMNSFYGVMGSAGSRLYHPSLPDAITGTGQWLLTESRKYLEELGHRVLYGDTDSLFVELSEAARHTISDYKAAGRALAQEMTTMWAKRLTKEFGAESYLVLEYKKHFQKFLVPAARQGEGGAKKRYAGLVVEGGSEIVEFVGLEVVRSDWTRLARDFQQELYTRIFKGEPVDEWIRDFVAKVKAGKFDEKLVYRKRLHKPAAEYGDSPPPYVRAALMLPKPGREVRYMITLRGPVPIDLEPCDPDYRHYIDKQLKPVADSILSVLGRSFDQVLSAQLGLFS